MNLLSRVCEACLQPPQGMQPDASRSGSSSSSGSNGSTGVASASSAGAGLDVIVIRQPDGRLQSTNWHAVFERVDGPCTVRITINDTVLDTGPCALHVREALQPAVFVGADSDPAGSPSPPASLLTLLTSSSVLREGRNVICYTVRTDRGVGFVQSFACEAWPKASVHY